MSIRRPQVPQAPLPGDAPPARPWRTRALLAVAAVLVAAAGVGTWANRPGDASGNWRGDVARPGSSVSLADSAGVRVRVEAPAHVEAAYGASLARAMAGALAARRATIDGAGGGVGGVVALDVRVGRLAVEAVELARPAAAGAGAERVRDAVRDAARAAALPPLPAAGETAVVTLRVDVAMPR